MDIYLNRTLELGQKVPYGGSDFELRVAPHTYFLGNPTRPGASFPVRLTAAVYCGDTEVLNLVAEVQPSTRALDLGYVLKYETGIGPQDPDRILAYRGSAPQSAPVGELAYMATGAYLVDQEVLVDEAHRRCGIATAMYQQAEALTGKQFLSRMGEILPVDAAAFWSAPDRPFGVDALYSQPRRLLWVNLSDLLPARLRELPDVVFDAERFTLSATGQRCINLSNQGAAPRAGLQEARIRGLMAAGHNGVVDGFVRDPHAPLKLMRAVNCTVEPATLALCNGKGLPDNTIAPPLAALTPESRDDIRGYIGRHMQALADLDALEVLHAQLRVFDRVLRRVHREHGDPTAIERAVDLRRTKALSVLTDVFETEAEFRASRL